MDKLIVERPRGGAGWRRKGRPGRDLEAMPFRDSARHRGDTKFLNENLAPLARFIRSRAGRPWNKVYGEIRERVNPTNTVQAHVLTHLPQLICLNPDVVTPDERFICGLAHPKEGRSRPLPLRVGEPYVDPESGLVRLARRRYSGPSTEPAPTSLRLGPGRMAVLDGGVWYVVDIETYDTAPGETPDAPLFVIAGRSVRPAMDPVIGPVVPEDTEARKRLEGLYGVRYIGVSRRQLSSKELRRHGLVNGSLDQ